MKNKMRLAFISLLSLATVGCGNTPADTTTATDQRTEDVTVDSEESVTPSESSEVVDPLLPVSVAIYNKKKTMESSDEAFKLKVAVDPETASQEVVYSSSDTAVATCIDGVVTPVGAGVTTIKVESKDHPEVYDSFELTITRTVETNNVTHEVIAIDKPTDSLNVIDFDATNVAYWERYFSDSVETKKGVSDLVETETTKLTKGGGDFDGSTSLASGAAIRANDTLSKSFAHPDYGQSVKSSVTISKKNNAFSIYTGVWGNDQMNFTIEHDGEVVDVNNWTVDSTQRVYEVKYTIDTSTWDDKRTEVYDLNLSNASSSGTFIYAGIAVYGEEQDFRVQVDIEEVDGVTITLDKDSYVYGDRIVGTVTSTSYSIKSVKINGSYYRLDDNKKFDVMTTTLGITDKNNIVTITPNIASINADFSTEVVESGSMTADFDASGIVYWERYTANKAAQCKDDSIDYIVSSKFEKYGRGGSDYGIDIKAGGKTSQTFTCTNLNGNEEKSFDTIIKVVKGIKKIVVYTGTWDSEVDMKATLKKGDTVYAEKSFDNGGKRVVLLTLTIDTESWDDGQEETLTLNLSHTVGQSMMCAGIVFYNK